MANFWRKTCCIDDSHQKFQFSSFSGFIYYKLRLRGDQIKNITKVKYEQKLRTPHIYTRQIASVNFIYQEPFFLVKLSRNLCVNILEIPHKYMEKDVQYATFSNYQFMLSFSTLIITQKTRLE